MSQVLRQLPKFESDRLIVGLDTSDDAAVYKINDEQAIIQTLDFFTPIVDDPYMFGQIAAANSLSDVYAMGGDPTIALNIVGFPTCLDMSILGEILKGGADKVKEAGALLVGGHTIEDNEPKYGLSVTGMVHPDRVLANAKARIGDALVITKPVGVGILNTAIKAELLDDEQVNEAMRVMAYLNKYPADVMKKYNVSACTDITGFGLAGHALEMAEGSDVTIEMDTSMIPVMDGVFENAAMGLVPAGAYRNKAYSGHKIHMEETISEEMQDVLYDPQTSGGLLIAVHPDDLDGMLKDLEANTETAFAHIGHVQEKKEFAIYFK